MGQLEGKVVLISGAARGQGRSHAELFASEGADVIALDICQQVASVAYPMSTPADLDETVRLVEKHGRRAVAFQTDVRDHDAVRAAVEAGLQELGHIDIVLANAGIMPLIGDVSHTQAAWQDAVDIMLTGVYNTIEACYPHMIERGAGGVIVITSSGAGQKGFAKGLDGMSAGFIGYTAAKYGTLGLTSIYANMFAPYGIRVNAVCPTGAATPMTMNAEFAQFGAENPTVMANMQNPLCSPDGQPVAMVEASDISAAMLYLCADSGRYVSGVVLPVDAGIHNRA